MTSLRPISEASRAITLAERIIRLAGAHYGVGRDVIAARYGVDDNGVARRRPRAASRARQIVMYLATADLGLSTTVVGRLLGGRDHTTVMHGRNVIAGLIETNSIMRERIEKIRASVGAAQ